MKLVDIEIRGVTALLIHRFGEEAEVGKQTRHAVVKARDPREEATKAAYIAADGTYYFSAFAIPNAMGAAGANHKLKGTRKTLRFVVPSAVRLQVEAITILNGNGPAKNFEVDSRPVTIPATKGRIMRHRPRFNEWGARFTLGIDDDLRELALAAVAYDDAIRACANDPDKMSSYCSAEGDDLDALYLRWMNLARAALQDEEPNNGHQE
jgi:hypothetical protein